MHTSESSNVAVLVTVADFARHLKERTRELLRPLLDLMDEAAQRGMILGFSCARDQLGRSVVAAVTVVKYL